MIKLTDYVTSRLATEYHVGDVFMISGGGAMHLVDSVGRQPGIRYLCPHHQQAAAIAAEGYSRATGKLAVVVVTSGPGSTNTLTGVIGQWLDSVPVLYLSGQVKQETTIESCRNVGLRQLGDQEINITDIVRPVTKYAAIVKDPATIRSHLDRAIYLATHGRPGPVWLDIPLDIQAALIDPEGLDAYDSGKDEVSFDEGALSRQVAQVVALLQKAERPVFLAGQGIRIGRGINVFRQVVEKLRIPCLPHFAASISSPHAILSLPEGRGRWGRGGNFALQNADLLISVGSRNNIRQVSYNSRDFARAATKIVVDIDEAELKKPTLRPDFAIHADAAKFLRRLKEAVETASFPDRRPWLDWCRERIRRYPVVLPEYRENKGRVNPYCFMETLTEALDEGAVVVTGNGTACVALFQAGIVKEGQRLFWNSGCASMGYDLPAAIGACVGSGGSPVVCLAGDGSLQMNIQELQTLSHHRFPVKLFVLNNEGYVSIRQTQDSFFEGRYTACGPTSGVSFPDIRRVAAAYGDPSAVIDSQAGLKQRIGDVLSTPGPVVCEVRLSPEQNFSPRVSSKKEPDGRIVSKPLEDMYPFLPREEFIANMIAEPLEE